MDRRKRNWIIFFVIAALAVGYFIVQVIRNSYTYLEWKTELIIHPLPATLGMGILCQSSNISKRLRNPGCGNRLSEPYELIQMIGNTAGKMFLPPSVS